MTWADEWGNDADYPEYVPITNEVRAAYRRAVGGSTWVDGRAAELDAQFDRWLQQVKADAWDEGKEYGEKRANREVHFQPNPYREGENSE